MRLLAQGHAKAFDELFRRYSSSVLGYCTRLAGSRASGEDISQEVWLRVTSGARTWQPAAPVQAWILVIARHTSLNSLRSRRRQEELNDEITQNSELETISRESVEDILIKKHDRAAALKAIEALPEMQRSALVMWLVEELSYEELAKELDLTVSAVKSLLFRARRTLEEILR